MKEDLSSLIDVLYEDNHLLAVNKKAGIPVQADESRDICLLDMAEEYLRKKYGKSGKAFTGIIHRIDRPVSGVVLIARTSKAQSRMNELFRERKVEKTYLCLVEGIVSEDGTVESWMKKDRSKNKSYSRKDREEGYKKAVLNYEVLKLLDRFTLLRVMPETGRHHQIRQQLAGEGHAIRGDVKYGARRGNRDGSICLHAASLTFMHPVKKESLRIEAPLPHTESWALAKK